MKNESAVARFVVNTMTDFSQKQIGDSSAQFFARVGNHIQSFLPINQIKFFAPKCSQQYVE